MHDSRGLARTHKLQLTNIEQVLSQLTLLRLTKTCFPANGGKVSTSSSAIKRFLINTKTFVIKQRKAETNL